MMEKVWFLGRLALAMAVLQEFLVADCVEKTSFRNITSPHKGSAPRFSLPVQLTQKEQVVLDNGIVRVAFSMPEGYITGIEYNGTDNLLETLNEEFDRGYLDVTWNEPGKNGTTERIKGTTFRVIEGDDNQVEISFTRTWNFTLNGSRVPLNIDQRYIMRSGISGFYSYAIYERLEGWPDVEIDQTRIVFKLQEDRFHYMATSDDRQRIMPMPQDRSPGRSVQLGYKEAVLLINPINPEVRGEVDDKYQYSCENKDNRVHGWISADPRVGFWMITPSNEFRHAGPIKQDLTAHVGPTLLNMFLSTHYAGVDVGMHFRNGEPWKKVFGPVFVYLNSFSSDEDPLSLWEDAKEQMLMETQSWPYDFINSEDFPPADRRGTVAGHLLVRDRYIKERLIWGNNAYVGLALPGEEGSWQRESKGYQFWAQADKHGYFLINNIRPGIYNLYAWVPGFLGDYKFNYNVTISPGRTVKLGVLVYEPPRNGPTLWEIGVPDRTAAEFFIPDPNPVLLNNLYIDRPDKFRQYGLWQRYSELYPDQDLIYDVSLHDYTLDWFFAHVTRYTTNNTYQPTTWQIKFQLKLLMKGNYTLRLALASAHESNLQVRFNDRQIEVAHFSTGRIGQDNAIARHGIHGLYWLFNVDVPSSLLLEGNNTIFLTQASHKTPFQGVMYDYIRLEGPRID